MRGQAKVVSLHGGITVRRMDFEFPDEAPRFWFDDNPFLTAMMAALSISFPAGERYFIDSVRHFQAQITDPELQAQIRAFIGQEANHTREHLTLNEFLERKGFPAQRLQQSVYKRLAYIQGKSSPAANLARTVALEHFTAIMSKGFMDHPEFLQKMDPAMARIWAWHAIEEVEHKSVAFDVYKATVDDERLRIRTMVEITVLFLALNTLRTLLMMRGTGSLFSPRAWVKGLNFLWGKPGVFLRIIPEYLDFYRRDFHPSQHRNSLFADAIKRRYLGEDA